MNYRKLKKDAKAVTNIVIIVLIVVLLLSASSVVVLLTIGQSATTTRKVVTGDTIKVNYIGRLAPPDNRVFDTSIYSVASNDALYPKSLSFGLRSNTSYTPLQFVVGSGSLIKGFESGVLGMSLNQTKTIIIPPSQGYGPMNNSKLFSFSLTDTVPLYVEMNQTVFYDVYNVTPKINLALTDPTWGWPARVIELNPDADFVKVQNMPSVGDHLAVFGNPGAAIPTGWYADVVSIDSTANGGLGIITIHHQLTSSDAGKVQGADIHGNFIIDEVVDGTARKNYNNELVGVTLYFTVTLYAFV